MGWVEAKAEITKRGVAEVFEFFPQVSSVIFLAESERSFDTFFGYLHVLHYFSMEGRRGLGAGLASSATGKSMVQSSVAVI